MDVTREPTIFSTVFDTVRNNTGYYINDTGHDELSESVWTAEVTARVATIVAVMVCALVGNVVLIIMIQYKPSRRIKRVNIFLVNLAIGDLAIACITMTTEILFVAFGDWVLGPIVCKLTLYLQIVTLASATFLLTGMSIDRYQVIVKPMQSLARRPKISTKVFVAWVLAFLFAIPQLFIFLEVEEGQHADGTPKKECASRGYNAPWQRKLYFSFMTVYILIIPSIIMVYCYFKIWKVIWSRAAGDNHNPNIQRKGGLDPPNSPRVSVRRNFVSASKRKVVMMALTVIIGFLVCLTPYFIVTLIRIYSNYTIKIKRAQMISELIFLNHSALNPILYGMFTLRIEHIHNTCRWFKWKRRLREDYEKNRMINENKCSKLRHGFVLLQNGNNYRDSSTIIANHAAKEEREYIVKIRSPWRKHNDSMFSRRQFLSPDPTGHIASDVVASNTELISRSITMNDSPDYAENATAL